MTEGGSETLSALKSKRDRIYDIADRLDNATDTLPTGKEWNRLLNLIHVLRNTVHRLIGQVLSENINLHPSEQDIANAERVAGVVERVARRVK